jgi:hypothetical protein
MNAQKLLNSLLELQEQGHDLSKIQVNYRQDYNSDVVAIEELEEDLFDEETNSVLESIVLISNTEEV